MNIVYPIRHRPAPRFAHTETVLAGLTVLFIARVLAQALQLMQPSAALPAFASFQGSPVPYALLLPVQLLICVLMCHCTLTVARGERRRDRARGRRLLAFGAVYGIGSLARLAIGLAVPAAPAWFQAFIPTVFHLVLCAFVLVLGGSDLADDDA